MSPQCSALISSIKDKKVDFLSSSQEGDLKPQYCLNGGSEVSGCVRAPPQRAAKGE